jgi:hypothetical protein
MTETHSLFEDAEGLSLRVDSFAVPEAARPEFDTAMRRNLAFLQQLPGFRGHLVLDKTGGPTHFNVVTVAAWESRAAHEAAAREVRAYYEKIGFDPAAALARWGATAELGDFARRSLP